ncbi:MAG TPA: ABC transporter permease subunit, partial [Pirellulaceae bacterium]
MKSHWKRWSRAVVPPVAFLLVFLVAWEVAVRTWEIPPLLLPGPLRVAKAVHEEGTRLAWATVRTAAAASVGFAISLALGTTIATLFSQSGIVRRSCFPYAILLQTVPIVAVAPVIVTWVGEGFWAVVIVATIISLFPIITNVTEGMTSIPLPLQELFAIHHASRWQTLWKLQLPHALPHLVTGARIASGSAV